MRKGMQERNMRKGMGGVNCKKKDAGRTIKIKKECRGNCEK